MSPFLIKLVTAAVVPVAFATGAKLVDYFTSTKDVEEYILVGDDTVGFHIHVKDNKFRVIIDDVNVDRFLGKLAGLNAAEYVCSLTNDALRQAKKRANNDALQKLQWEQLAAALRSAVMRRVKEKEKFRYNNDFEEIVA